MRKKFFLFIIAAFMATSSAWAGIDDDLHQYLTNIQYEKTTGALTFNDVFQNSISMPRWYIVEAYIQDEGNAIYQDGVKGYFYGNPSTDQKTSDLLHRSCFIAAVEYERYGFNTHSGGQRRLYITELLTKCYQAGYYKIHIAIRPQYAEIISHNTKEYGSYQGAGCWLKNSIDLNLPVHFKKVFVPSWAKYGGDPMIIESTIQAADKCKYYIQESNDGGASWTTKKSGSLTAVQAREGATVSYKRVITGNHDESIQFRTRVVSFEAPYGWIHRDTTEVKTVRALYPCTYYDQNGTSSWTEWHTAGEEVVYMKPADCRDYRYTSELPVKVEEKEAYLSMTMPACPVWIKEYTPTYQVDFYDADATLLKTEEVAAGEDATPPAMAQNAPAANHAQQAKTGTFTGWSKDYTNVHKQLKVFAKYDVYVDMDIDVVSHTCNRTEDWNFMSWRFIEFEDNKTMAMAGDNITFRASVKTNTPVNVYFQSGQLMNNGEISWTTATKVGEITGYDMNKVMTFDRQVTAAVEYNNELPFQTERYYRFYAAGAGTAEKVYSEAMEIEMYYPLLIEADQEVCVMSLHGAFFYNGTRSIVPAQYGDTIFISDHKGFNGAGLDFAFVRHPASIQDGTSDEGLHYVLGPGMTETVNVTTQKKVVWFDGVYGNGYPKQFDFSAQGMGKYNGYYAAVAKVGESVLPPADPEMDGYVFLGWKNETTTEYDDDAYLKIPAISDPYLEFTAQWEEIPAAPQYTVRFYGKDGSQLIETQSVEEGQNATPPTAPEVSGFHFVGWDKAYTTIKADVDITALYGEDTKTWTVTYKNWDGTDLGTEQVNDGEAAQGVNATREGYTFVGWSEDISSVRSNMTVTALFDVSVFTIIYTIDGVEIMGELVSYGEMPTAYQAVEDQGKPATEQYVYTFDHWNPAIVAATSDATYEAVFTPSLRQYLVRFQNWDHTFLSEQQVEYGKAAQAPAEPAKEGYTFIGWDREFNNILANMTVTAVFEMTKNQGGANAIEDIDASAKIGGSHKLLRDGQLFIERNGKTYNAQGAEVK